MTMSSSLKPTARPELRYSALTLVAMAAIYALSSVPDLGTAERDPRLALVWNLSHVPAFGILAFVLLKAISGTGSPSWDRYALAFLASTAYASLDEWHQSFVAGRHASISDFVLDVVGIGGMVLVLRLSVSAPRELGGMPRPATKP